TDSVDTAGVDTGQTDSVDSTGVDTGQTDSVDSTGVDTGQTDSVDTKVTHISKRKPAYEIALKYFEEHGKFPSYRDLGELAGCSKDTAGKAIKKAKERLKQTG
ncbi:hypothetical protein, partial [Kroppenstedtia eburnea]|uniref:hypothetical protein n=1 Tax=Kroppenstedtia eburnea TaxID=714067 RepID=UPI0036D2EA90